MRKILATLLALVMVLGLMIPSAWAEDAEPEFLELTLKKEWPAASQSPIPESVTVNVLRDGAPHQAVTLTAAEGWTKMVQLPLLNAAGEPYEYTWQEVATDGFASKVTDEVLAAYSYFWDVSYSGDGKTTYISTDSDALIFLRYVNYTGTSTAGLRIVCWAQEKEAAQAIEAELLANPDLSAQEREMIDVIWGSKIYDLGITQKNGSWVFKWDVNAAATVVNGTEGWYGIQVVPGKVTATFTAYESVASVRVFGANRYATAFLAADYLKEQLGVNKFENIVVACGTNFADALSGSYLAAKKNAPVLLVEKARVNEVKAYIRDNLASGGTVYLLGGTVAIPETMESGLEGFAVKRLAGANRYGTNLAILDEAGVTNEEILVATGTNFADSLSAAASGRPILMVSGNSLTAEQKSFLEGHAGNELYILGGTAAVSAKMETALKAYDTTPTRLGGANRYATSVLIAETFFPEATKAVLAYGRNFPDGLSGGALAYQMKAPLLLAATKEANEAIAYAEGKITSGVVLGGPGLISDAAVRSIFHMAATDELIVLGGN